jgi:serine/threonine-protein kinase
MGLLAKDPAARPSSAAAVVSAMNSPAAAPPVDDGTRVLPILASSEPVEAAEPELDDHEAAPPRRRLPFAKAIVGLAVVLAGLVIAALLRQGVSDPTAEAGGAPSTTPSVTAKPVVKPSATPSKTPSKRPTPKSTPSAPKTASPESLRALARLLRENHEGKGSKAAREAAKDLDEAADALADGDTGKAVEKFQDARQRLIEAQRDGRWHSTPQISALFGSIGRTLFSDNGGGGQ